MTEQMVKQRPEEDKWSIVGLAADGPLPELKEELGLFGQFVGDWDMNDRFLKDDGTWAAGKGGIHWRWILEGRALQRRCTPPRPVAHDPSSFKYRSSISQSPTN